VAEAGERLGRVTRQDDIAHISAKYLLETDDGEFIAIENEELIQTQRWL